MSTKRFPDGITSRRDPEQIQAGYFLTGLQALKRILNWLARLIQLTDEEQRDAGIDLGYQHNK